MRKYKGHQIERAHELFEELVGKYYNFKIIKLYGQNGQSFAVIIDGKTLGFYRHSTEKLHLPDGSVYDFRTGLLLADEGLVACDFSEVLRRRGFL